MLEKLKSIGQAAKNVVIFIITPLFALGIYIAYLLSRNRQLNEDNEAGKAEGKLNELEGEKKSIDAAADDASLEFQRARDRYYSNLPGSDRSGGKGPGSEGPSSKDQG